VGSERYTPYLQSKRPAELLTQANRILGTGQLSLAKYLFISAGEQLDCHSVEKFLTHVFERIDLRRDLHFYTKTSIDTLDYSGDAINEGSKLVLAAYGDKLRTLATSVPAELENGKLIMPGVIMLPFEPFTDHSKAKKEISELCNSIGKVTELQGIVQIVVHDAFEFGKDVLKDYLWITYTRSNPSHDVYGVEEFMENKHWGCRGAMVIDARKKPHHAPELVVDPNAAKKADEILKKFI
jgi:4-hydroxy-3-polyprenylbenzoate decarboxylase